MGRDINQDGAINMSDVLQIAKHFNSTSGSSKYNAQADLNSDGAVNMTDVLIVANTFQCDYFELSRPVILLNIKNQESEYFVLYSDS
jgi:hypothetical protein